ncbi:hypothetical protein QFC19_000743 [Naganishia cerealis]|uniref:Uncharacterized protein n=1 Tax=Naganishia cerealis TaxID=610337 RepID=A0ACC2WLN5_9TREE|nr:hypothetical protein QFC19_000743 [Naganishia cerealis]
MGVFSRKKSLPAIETKATADPEKFQGADDDDAMEPQTPGMESNFNMSTTSFNTYDEKSIDYSHRPTISNTDALDIMGDHLFRYGCNWKKWFQPVDEESYYYDSDQVVTGLCLRSDNGGQRSYPLDCAGMSEFEWAVAALNPAVAFKIRSPIVMSIMATYMCPDDMEFTINANTRIQILDELPHLARAKKHQYAAFVRDEGVLCVWSDSVKTIVADVEKLEKALLNFVWSHEEQKTKANAAQAEAKSEKTDGADVEDPSVTSRKNEWRARPVMMYEAFLVGFTVILMIFLLSLGYSKNALS